MFNFMQNGVSLVDLQNVNDSDIASGQIDLGWDSVVELFSVHEYRTSKNGRCFIPASLKPGDQWVLSDSDNPTVRNDANIDSITMIVLDLDTPGAREKAEAIYADFEYMVYSTHSYTKDTPYKFRIVIRLEDPIPGADWPLHFKTLVAPIDADRSCGNLSMVYFFPSHNPLAEIRPYFYHHKGRVMSHDDLIGLKHRIVKMLSPQQLASISAIPFVPQVKKHFTGVDISVIDAANSVVDYTYEGLSKRFSSHLNSLATEDNRHNFALRVLKKEVSERKSKIDFFQIIQFIYRASSEFGSKSIVDPSGNTRDELPEMVTSAVKKFCPEILSSKNPAYLDLRSHVKRVVQEVDQIAISGSWKFETKPRSNSKMDEARKAVLGALRSSNDGFDDFKSRNIAKIRHLISTGKYVDFARDVIRNECAHYGDKININLLGQHVFYCYSGYIDKVLGVSGDDRIKLIDQYSDGVITGIDDILSPVENAGDETKKFFVTSIKIAKNSAIKGSWKFPTQQDLPQTAMSR
jgi:hypothetical protein